MTDPTEHVPTEVVSNVSLFQQPQLKWAIDKFTKELNAGTVIKYWNCPYFVLMMSLT